MNMLPLRTFAGEVVLVDREEKVAGAIEELMQEKIVGFDTETKPAFHRGLTNTVALLQLSTAGKAWLFRINRIGLPLSLRKLLASDAISKIGVAIHDDIKALQRVSPFPPAGFIELQQMVREFGIEELSLRKLAGIVLGMRISKAQRLTNWEADILTVNQQIYAATDAWVACLVYETLLKARHATTELNSR
jgi:ribonuclease D